MANRNFQNSPPIACHKWLPWLRGFLIIGMAGTVLVSLTSWLLPMEVFQSWALERAEADPYKRFEAVGRAEFSLWLIRVLTPIVGLGVFFLLRSPLRTGIFLSMAYSGWMKVTQFNDERDRTVHWRTIVFRGVCIVWGLLALGHAGQAVHDSMSNWAYYRFRPGSQVLPNISDSNREVIRYLQEVTNPGSRIFVASDQKLYFLSYYLLPRRLYYKVHPDAEFVVAQPFQQRRMEAYQLSEIDTDTVDRIHPDYILEYFEHREFVDRSRLHDDPVWLSFYRMSHRDPAAEPAYLVCLRRFQKGDGR